MGQQLAVSFAIVIPARFASTRLPGKPLADLEGLPLIQRVYDRVAALRPPGGIVVATDDARIAGAVRSFGGVVAMTYASCPSGTDRVAEAARSLRADVFVNLQGDEPFVDPASVTELVAAFGDPEVQMATLSREARAEELPNPNVVKVVCDARGDALYFSRQAIPFSRNGSPPPTRAHVGVYAYRAAFLQRLASLAPTPLEKSEGLEQLRVLEHGWRIRVVPTAYTGFGIDTPEDLERARRFLRS